MMISEQGARQPSSGAALYANGKSPLVFDAAVFTRAFEDGPPVTAEVQIARVDYERKTAVIVFGEHDREAIQALSLGRHFHTTVSLGELRDSRRAEEVNPDFQISHEMALTLHALSGGELGFDFHSQIEGAVSGALAGRRLMLRAEDAIAGHIYYSQRQIYSYDCTFNPENLPASHFAQLAGNARQTALTRLSHLTGAEALSVIEGNRIPDLDGSSFPIVSIEDVQKRRVHLRAAARMVKRLTRQAGNVRQRMREVAQTIQQYACSSDLNWNGSAARESKERSRALDKLSRLSDSAAWRVIATNPIQSLDGTFPLATINEVRQRRRYRRTGLHLQTPRV